MVWPQFIFWSCFLTSSSCRLSDVSFVFLRTQPSHFKVSLRFGLNYVLSPRHLVCIITSTQTVHNVWTALLILTLLTLSAISVHSDGFYFNDKRRKVLKFDISLSYCRDWTAENSQLLPSPPRGDRGPSHVSVGSSKSDTFHWLGGFLVPVLSSSAPPQETRPTTRQ